MRPRIKIAEDNYFSTFSGMTETLPTGVGLDLEGALHIHCGADIATFNPSILREPSVPVERFLRQASAFHGQHGSPAWTIATRVPDAPIAEPALKGQGFRYGFDVPFMVLDEIPGPERLDGLVVERVTGIDGLRCHFEIVAQAFETPFGCFEPVCHPAILDARFGFFVGRCDGVPVATALYAVSTGAGVACAGIYNVCTLASHRGRGLGRAMTAHAMDAGRREHGCVVAVLQASSMGRPVYERMGFREVTRWTMWLPPR
ncbi:GNAT family N-acetyltransferase [Defluviimonas sp. WL0024]|uniref:GNAT family N-acetyltransferase n=1 Tax=Albidovulum salinarum TaxID=2984153 RepID=A0ABT2XBI9_9RHOB|nr:GNAT family N-acetyltransferase [Defluviimonas sp. WL0024]MCU9849070.1 GNAT family N-acetyltransferase [Defluviimonas sp. WL0024]